MIKNSTSVNRTRAARLTGHGAPLSVEEVDLPAAGPDEVLVDLAYSAVNPVDRYIALGRVAPDAALPRTLGGEGAGTAEGRPVLVRGYGLGVARDGLWANRAVVPREALIDIPEGVGLREAAAMGVAGVTAWRCVTEKAVVTPEDRVLVLGASGGVGSAIVSLASSLGATVWGQSGSAEKAEWITRQGAGRAVVATAEELPAAVAELAPTVVFDPLGADWFGAAVTALCPGGRLVSFGTSAGPVGEVPLQDFYRKGLSAHGYAGLISSDEELAAACRRALEAVSAGRLRIAVDQALPLDGVNEAFELIAGRRVLGKLLLDLG